MERVPLKQTDRHHKSPGGDLCIRDRAMPEDIYLLLRGDFFSQCAFFLCAEESHFQTINLCLADLLAG